MPDINPAFKRFTGEAAAATADPITAEVVPQATVIDWTFASDFLTGFNFILIGAAAGDHFTVEIFDVDNVNGDPGGPMLQSVLIEDWGVNPTAAAQGAITLSQIQPVTPGTYIRLIYTTYALAVVKITCNVPAYNRII